MSLENEFIVIQLFRCKRLVHPDDGMCKISHPVIQLHYGMKVLTWTTADNLNGHAAL